MKRTTRATLPPPPAAAAAATAVAGAAVMIVKKTRSLEHRLTFDKEDLRRHQVTHAGEFPSNLNGLKLCTHLMATIC